MAKKLDGRGDALKPLEWYRERCVTLTGELLRVEAMATPEKYARIGAEKQLEKIKARIHRLGLASYFKANPVKSG